MLGDYIKRLTDKGYKISFENPIEEAEAFKRLIDEFHLKQDEVAEKVCKSRVAVTNSLRLLKLDSRVREMIIEDKIKSGHARSLLAIEDGNEQYNAAIKIFDEKLKMYIRNISFKKSSLSKIKMIIKIYSDYEKADADNSKRLSAVEAISLALALSLDGFSAGIAFNTTYFLIFNVFVLSLVIISSTFLYNLNAIFVFT